MRQNALWQRARPVANNGRVELQCVDVLKGFAAIGRAPHEQHTARTGTKTEPVRRVPPRRMWRELILRRRNESPTGTILMPRRNDRRLSLGRSQWNVAIVAHHARLCERRGSRSRSRSHANTERHIRPPQSFPVEGHLQHRGAKSEFTEQCLCSDIRRSGP